MQDSTSTGDIGSQIDDTTAALSGGLTAVPLDAAAGVVSKWQSTLAGSGNPHLESIADDLGQLGSQLSGGNLNASAVGVLLSGLSEKVTTVAGTQSGMVASSLTKLSGALSSAGSQLSS